MEKVTEYFGSMVFDERQMKARLTEKVYKSLKRTNWYFNYRIPDYEQMVAEMAEWIYKHKELYPHYNL